MQPDTEMGTEAARVQTIVDNAERLGLVWILIPATVATEPSSSQGLTGVVDQDTEAIGLISCIGGELYVGDRVMVAKVPPAGNFILGRAVTLPVYRWTALGVTILGAANNFQVPSATQENIGGWTVNTVTSLITVPQDGRYDIRISVATNTGGVANSRQAIILDVTTTVPNMITSYRNMWTIGEANGTMTVSPVRLNKGDTLRVNVIQNSAGSMAGSVYFEAVRMP